MVLTTFLVLSSQGYALADDQYPQDVEEHNCDDPPEDYGHDFSFRYLLVVMGDGGEPARQEQSILIFGHLNIIIGGIHIQDETSGGKEGLLLDGYAGMGASGSGY
jgi:hypothetical protein